MNSCSGGACKQGRARCGTPHACQLPDEPLMQPMDAMGWAGRARFVLLVLVVFAVLYGATFI